MPPTVDDVVVDITIDRSPFGWKARITVDPTRSHAAEIAMGTLHDHVREQLNGYVLAHGFTPAALTWDDVEIRGGEPFRLTATADLRSIEGDTWASIRRAVDEDEHDRRMIARCRELDP